MSHDPARCPDCDSLSTPPASLAAKQDSPASEPSRRTFLKTAGVAAIAASAWPVASWSGISAVAAESTSAKPAPETLTKKLYESLSDMQRKQVAFAWDHKEPKMGLLRTHISNNWHITKPTINSDFFTKDQQEMIRGIFEGLYNPDWLARIEKQIQDDAGGYGKHQNIALFGKPGEKFEFVMTGRHLTIRCDGNTEEHVAFGGPIFYGHAPGNFNEKANHDGNVFWPQAVVANKIYEMLDGKQRKQALLSRAPAEAAVGFRGADAKLPGISVKEFSSDQQEALQKTLSLLLEPYRTTDRDEALACLKKQGGLEKCSLAFYQQGDIGDDGVWDNWRLEGPSFVWYFRGSPHVHTWVNIADNAEVKTNSEAYL